MAEYRLLFRIPFFPTLIKYAEEKVEEEGNRLDQEVGTVPQQVPKAPILTAVTLNSRDLGPQVFMGYY